MDALSSQATVAGYRAALIAAQELGRFFPMLMTAAGTIPPAQVLVLGAGVAGLQAIATARRLGAVVTAFDVRAAVKEQVQSLGAKFLEVEGGAGRGGRGRLRARADRGRAAGPARGARGAARALRRRHHHRARPGPPGAQAHDAERGRGMKPGSVIVDLAGEAGGNCELTAPGETDRTEQRRDDRRAAQPAERPCPSTPRSSTRATSVAARADGAARTARSSSTSRTRSSPARASRAAARSCTRAPSKAADGAGGPMDLSPSWPSSCSPRSSASRSSRRCPTRCTRR